MSCNLTEIRRQLEDMQKIMDEYNCYHRDDEPLDEKAIVERTKQACIEAYNNYMVSDEDVKTHYGAIKAIQEVE